MLTSQDHACHLLDPLLPSTSISPSKLSVFSRVPSFTLKRTLLSSSCRATVPSKYAWVNPRSRRAPRLPKGKGSGIDRHVFLVGLARTLDEGGLDQVRHVLAAHAGERPFSEQDAVTVINIMTNPDAAVVVLGFFLDYPAFDKVVIYNLTMNVLKNSKDLIKMEQLFREMLQSGLTPDNYTFSTLITCAWNCNLPLKSVEWFEKMPSFGVCPDGVILSVMIDAYSRAGNAEMALSMYDRTRSENRTPPSATCRAIAAAQEESVVDKYPWLNPMSRGASRLFNGSNSIHHAFLVSLAHTLDEVGFDQVHHVLAAHTGELPFSAQDAVTVIKNMSNPDTTMVVLGILRDCPGLDRVIIYNATMKVLKESKDLVRAEQLFHGMLQRGVTPDKYTFFNLITCARNCNLPHKSVEWFEKMPAFGVCLDGVFSSVMIDAYGRIGNVEMASSIYDRARTENWHLDRNTFTTLIKVHSTRGNFDSCLNVYEEMKSRDLKPNVGTYNIMLHAMGRAKRPRQVKAIHAEMLREGVSPSCSTYMALLHGFSICRCGADALQVYREMKDKGMTPLTLELYNAFLAMCADLDSLEEAVEVYEDMRASEVMPDDWTFSFLINIFSSRGKVSEAEKFFNEMLALGIEPHICILTSLVQCFGNARLTDNVVRVCQILYEHKIPPDDRFCGCLLNLMSQSPREELWKMIGFLERADVKLGRIVRLLADELGNESDFKQEADQLFESSATNSMKVYCNCLIDLCVNLDMLERGCYLLDLAVRLCIYKNLQSKSAIQWSLNVKSLSVGAALTAMRAWINDLSKALEAEESLPPVLGINTGHGKLNFPKRTLAGAVDSYLKELGAPFHADPSELGLFSTTNEAAESWLKSRKEAQLVDSSHSSDHFCVKLN